jgi:hypothetical protein
MSVRLMLFAGGSGDRPVRAGVQRRHGQYYGGEQRDGGVPHVAGVEDRNQYRLKAKGGRGFTCEVLLICDRLH